MNRKFQVFISSTYLDLRAERQVAVQAVLDAGHIPAGMELFSAGDDEQIEVIKRWIDDSDIYMLILGVRYGSTEPKSKKSYTHIEYEYAVAQRKPVFAVYLADRFFDERVKDLSQVIAKEDRAGYEEFRKLVKSRMCSEFGDPRDITIAVLKTLTDFSRKPELQNNGWVRGHDLPDTGQLSSENSKLSVELSRLTADTARLAAENQELRAKTTAAALGEEERFGHFGYHQLVATLGATLISLDGPKLTLLDAFVQNQDQLIMGVRDSTYDSGDPEWMYKLGARLLTFGLVERGTRFNKPLLQTSKDGERFLATHAIRKLSGT